MKLLFSLILMTTAAYAEFPLINIQNMNGDYANENGRAHAEKGKYSIDKVKIRHQDIYIDFNKKDKNLIIKDETTTVELDFDFSFLNVFKAFSVSDLDIVSDRKIFSINSGDLDLFISPKKYQLKDFFVETDISALPRNEREDTTIIDGLVLNAKLLIKKISFSNFDDDLFDELKNENPTKVDEIEKIKKRGQALEIPMIIRNVKYKVEKGDFFGKAKIDSYINLWFRVWGSIETDKKNSFIKITIRKAKLGWFGITRTILRLIKKMKLDGVEVNGKVVTIDLENVVLGDQNRQTQDSRK